MGQTENRISIYAIVVSGLIGLAALALSIISLSGSSKALKYTKENDSRLAKIDYKVIANENKPYIQMVDDLNFNSSIPYTILNKVDNKHEIAVNASFNCNYINSGVDKAVLKSLFIWNGNTNTDTLRRLIQDTETFNKYYTKDTRQRLHRNYELVPGQSINSNHETSILIDTTKEYTYLHFLYLYENSLDILYDTYYVYLLSVNVKTIIKYLDKPQAFGLDNPDLYRFFAVDYNKNKWTKSYSKEEKERVFNTLFK